MPKVSKEQHEESLAQLRQLLQPGDTVYGTVLHVARSGMSRTIDLTVYRGDARNPRRVWLSDYVASAIGLPRDHQRGGIKVGGCGQDMIFATVYELAQTMFPDGFTCAGERCQSNDHSNGDRDYTPHHHANGGYAFHVES